MAKIYDFSLEDIEAAGIEKKELRGGFDTRLYSDFIEIDSDNSA
jgi:hypothetical protein